jgi:hypothetical protein
MGETGSFDIVCHKEFGDLPHPIYFKAILYISSSPSPTGSFPVRMKPRFVFGL